MDRLKYHITMVSVIVIILMALGGGAVRAENIDPDSTGCKYAWSENAGWLNFKPSLGPGVTVTDNNLTGYVWGENIGWITSPALMQVPVQQRSTGCRTTGTGFLSGYAWGENVGWIKFNPTGGE